MTATHQAKMLQKIIHARAPIRINDLGGWSDTWFAAKGQVLNLAVWPAVEVEVKVFSIRSRDPKRVTVHAENYRETFRMDPEKPRRDTHPLLQFTIASLPLPKDIRLEIRLYSPVPAGISTGTSAAVCVALLGALNVLLPEKRSWKELARLAHQVETNNLGQQSGIQDQIAASHGGISFIHIPRYPESRVTAVGVGPALWRELERRLCLVYLGKPHRSSSMHERVIAELESRGPLLTRIRELAALAREARDELRRGDLESYGRSMIRNNECQRALYAGLIAREADSVAKTAKRFGASGWKVNGAGGRGGSMTILANGEDELRRRMIKSINGMGGGIRIIPVSLAASGVEAWESSGYS
jgi:D-glycero-alpha-D-manno-heptose-7-phosphate kinase